MYAEIYVTPFNGDEIIHRYEKADHETNLDFRIFIECEVDHFDMIPTNEFASFDIKHEDGESVDLEIL